MEDFFGRIFPKPQNSSRIGFFKGHFFFMKDLSHERPGWLAGWLASLAVLWLALRQGVYRLQKASDIENTCPKQLLFSHETVFRFMKKKKWPWKFLSWTNSGIFAKFVQEIINFEPFWLSNWSKNGSSWPAKVYLGYKTVSWAQILPNSFATRAKTSQTTVCDR